MFTGGNKEIVMNSEGGWGNSIGGKCSCSISLEFQEIKIQTIIKNIVCFPHL